MSVQVLNLANGTLPTTSQTTIYTSPVTPAPLSTIVKNIRLVNTSSSIVVITLFYLPNLGVTNRQISPVNMSIPPGGLAIDDQEITMAAGDVIIAMANVAAAIVYVISGIQR